MCSCSEELRRQDDAIFGQLAPVCLERGQGYPRYIYLSSTPSKVLSFINISRLEFKKWPLDIWTRLWCCDASMCFESNS